MAPIATAEAALARLHLWFSPAFPTGAFSYSHGLEWAVEAGDVADGPSLAAWLEALLERGSGWGDAVLFARARDMAARGAGRPLARLADLAAALSPARERRQEAMVQGGAFLKAVEAAWPNPGVALLRAARPGPCPLPVAAGAACHDAPAPAAVAAYLTGWCANLVSAAVRLAPIGQAEGLRALARLEPAVAGVGARALTARLADLGGCAWAAEIGAMRHETQGTRLFRS